MPKIKLIASTPRLDTALRNLVNGIGTTNLANVEDPGNKPQTIDPIIQQTSVESTKEYSGYFTIVDLSETDEAGVTTFRVGVVDGLTYDSATEKSDPSYAQINGVSVAVNMFSDNIEDDVTTFVQLEYIEATGQTAIVLSKNELLPSDDSQLHTLIGRVYFIDGVMYIEQTHTSGVITMNSAYRGGFKLLVTPRDAGGCKLTGGYVDALGYQPVQDTAIGWTGNVYFNVLYSVAQSAYSYSVTDAPVNATETMRAVSILIGSFDGQTAVQKFTGNFITLAGDYVI